MKWSTLLCCLVLSTFCIAQSKTVMAHAHNDYEQKHPLTTALSFGFQSLEVDLVLYQNELIVTHDDKDLDQKPRFIDLYLKPLIDRKDSIKDLILLLDIKYNNGAILDTLHKLVSGFPELFDTRADDSKPIKILLSGDVPRVKVAQDSNYKYFFIDGRPEDIEQLLDSHIVPWISTNFTDCTSWEAKSKPKRSDLLPIYELIKKVQKQGKQMRFWKTRDHPLCWSVLMGLGIDIIGVDAQKKFYYFLK